MKRRSVAEVAHALQLSPQRVRVLASRGLLEAEKLGNQWVVNGIGPDRRSRPGRPVSAANAWGLLALLAGEVPEWLDPSVRSRLKRRLREPGWVLQGLGCSQPRAAVERLRVLPVDLIKLEDEVIKSGLSANYPELDVLLDGEMLDGYVSRQAFEAIDRRLHPLRGSSRPNVVLRIPQHDWVLDQGARVPVAVAAADLLHAEDARERRAARDLLLRLAG